MLRFAPSPTGDMHTGNLRAAIFNYILAKQRGEKFLVRIEDTDMERNIEGKDKEILSLLNLFGMVWDELVYQSHNFPRHAQMAEYLLSQGKAFYCYCSKEFLDQKREEALAQKLPFRYHDAWAEIEKDSTQKPVIRLRGASEEICFKDEIKGIVSFKPHEVDSFVIVREDGIPTYNFACAIDDMLYDVSFIVRGEDHVSNTPKQMLIQRGVGYEKLLQYAHLPILLNEEGKKMSKRDNASSVKWLLEEGYLPQAIANYLILMGNKTPTEVFTLKEAIEWFDITHVAKAPAKFDLDKLRFLNREHFKRLSEQDLAFLLDHKDPSVGGLAKLYLQESSTLNELRPKIDALFAPKIAQGEFASAMILLYPHLRAMIEEFSPALKDFEAFKKEAMERSGLKGKPFFKSLRLLLTGSENGPELSDLFEYARFFFNDIIRLKEPS
ncbi:glutamate--tRNA ligase [Wolinella succinogenes]|uniref:glutamate--tRNA ligase n=1 Tax=Wolinella succinogenes TaxID=844 RepID=UPI0016AA2835|nr:glutamate--tRNA ligase [Wolinella succinogenes]NLU34551.1 glutamate--tRNA ligase [Wolinella succinogenes]